MMTCQPLRYQRVKESLIGQQAGMLATLCKSIIAVLEQKTIFQEVQVLMGLLNDLQNNVLVH